MFACTKFRRNSSHDIGFRTRKPPQKFGVKQVALKNITKMFHTVTYLKIPFYSHQSTFGRDEDFFLFLNIVRSSPKRHTTEEKKAVGKQNCIVCAIAKYKQCKQNLRCTNNANKIREISPKKVLVKWLLNRHVARGVLGAIAPPNTFHLTTCILRWREKGLYKSSIVSCIDSYWNLKLLPKAPT